MSLWSRLKTNSYEHLLCAEALSPHRQQYQILVIQQERLLSVLHGPLITTLIIKALKALKAERLE